MSHTKWRWVGHLFTYFKTCERSRVKDFEQRSRVYYTVRYNTGFFPWTRDDHVIMESQCNMNTCIQGISLEICYQRQGNFEQLIILCLCDAGYSSYNFSHNFKHPFLFLICQHFEGWFWKGITIAFSFIINKNPFHFSNFKYQILLKTYLI